MASAIPWPPPMHIVTTPFLRPSRRIYQRTRQDFVCRRNDCLRTGATDPIHGHGRDLDRQFGVDRRPPREIHFVTGLYRIPMTTVPISPGRRPDRSRAPLIDVAPSFVVEYPSTCRRMSRWQCEPVRQSRPNASISWQDLRRDDELKKEK